MNYKDCVLGIELGSTKIKAVLTDKNFEPVASSSYGWENRLENGIWTYSYEEIEKGVKECFAKLKNNAEKTFGVPLTTVGAIGVSGMMHGYLPLDKNRKPLAGFRTWRNRITEAAATKLTKELNFNIPQRWSIAHLYEAVLKKEEHLSELASITTVSGYICEILSGKNVLGIGEASGVFPIDSKTRNYDEKMLDKAAALINPLCNFDLRDVLPKVAVAGEKIGELTKSGALFLDPTGTLEAGIPICAPEGDAGTGMVATNSVRPLTGNVSAGTSVFAMIVTDKPLSMHKEIDMVTTPSGEPAAMVHCNNCTSDLNAWTDMLYEFSEKLGAGITKEALFDMLFKTAMDGEADCGGTVACNYISGEAIANLSEGRPMLIRKPDAKLSLSNFMRATLYSALVTLKIGMDIVFDTENIKLKSINAHGGYFKVPKVGPTILSAAIETPVSVMKTSGEGGPYGMSLLAAYMLWKDDGEKLEDFLDNKVFKNACIDTVMASESDIAGFKAYTELYKKALAAENAAVENIK